MNNNIVIEAYFGINPDGGIRVAFVNTELNKSIAIDMNKLIHYERALYVDRFRSYNGAKFDYMINYVAGGFNQDQVIETVAYTVSGIMFRIHASEILKSMINKFGDIKTFITIPKTVSSQRMDFGFGTSDENFLKPAIGFNMSNDSDFYIQFIFNKNSRMDAEALILNPVTGVFTVSDLYLYRITRGTRDYREEIAANVFSARTASLYTDTTQFDKKYANTYRRNLNYTLTDIYFEASKNMPADGKYYMKELSYNPYRNKFVELFCFPIEVGNMECSYEEAESYKRVYTRFK